MQNTDITIVGAGLAGASCAALLAQSGFDVCLIDNQHFAQWQPEQPIKRVSSLNQAARRIFEHIDVWQDIQAYACPFSNIRVWQNQNKQQINFNSRSQGYSALAYIIENDLVTSRIINRLKQQNNVRLIDNSSISTLQHNQQQILLNNGEKIQTTLIVGADGINSQMRRLAGIDLERQDYAQRAIVCNISLSSHNAKECNTAWQCFLDTGPLALLPLYNGEYSIVWSCTIEHYARLQNLSDHDFCKRLSKIIEPHLPAVKHISQRFTFPITHQHAKSYYNSNIRLIGDAAHTTHPLAGIGANLGLLDAAALAQILNDAKSKNQPITRMSLASQYQHWRRGENVLALNTMRAFNYAFTNTKPNLANISGLGLGITDKITPVKFLFSDIAMGNIGDLPKVCKPIS